MSKSSARRKEEQERRRFRWCGEMCGSCAYRPGTEASREYGDPGLTRARLALLKNNQPFHCHEDAPAGLDDKTRKLCVGHMNSMKALAATGHEPTEADREDLRAAMRRLHCERAITDAIEGIEPEATA